MIDAHIHLEQYDRISDQIERWRMGGVKSVIAVSNNLASSYRTLELKEKYPDFVFACVGFHPEYELPKVKELEEWKSLIRLERKRITGIGEIGLPHYQLDKLSNSLPDYIQFLAECFEVANEHKLPVALHAVHDKAGLVLQLLKTYKINKAHFHWLKAPADVLQAIVESGYYLTVTPEVCYRERDQQLLMQVPLSQLLIETDGPWEYHHPMFKQERTTPLFLEEMVQTIARLKRINTTELEKQLTRNTLNCYVGKA
ncbi:TatD family hydrolase [Halalkalibacter urbisdiaboli]|uniref:TatD family hydrolase n=1 Tax=Halalkalibacter urbisdiaboli TaxID=1960589 RepID=UPI000B4489C9|nr:TatD family hydrolase [Halalkalibacter urbisdiaboli]